MNRIVSFALRQRVLIVVLLVMMLGAGVASFLALNIEAYPDPVPPLVDVVTQSTGQSAEEIERYITIPLEIQMAGIPNVQAIRTISLFGLSDVKVQFTYDFTYNQAEQWVINRLSQLGPLPNGAQPQISPTSPIGEIFRYRVVGPAELFGDRSEDAQDWVLERRFKAVPGVIDVTGWGGKTKTYEIAIDQHKLMGYGLSVPQVLAALGNANINVGGQTVNFGAQAAVVRGVGLIHSADEIRHTLIANNQGAPVFIGDVADGHHRQSAAPRHRGLQRRRRHRAGHRADAPRREERAHHQARRSGGGQHQQERHPAARRQHPAHLRPQRFDPHHHPHRAAQHDRRHRAHIPAAVGVPRQPAQRRHRRHDHTVRPVLRHRAHGAARRIREFAVGRARSISGWWSMPP